MQEKKLLLGIDILIACRTCDRKIVQPIRITSRLPARMMKGNQFSYFRQTSIKVIPIKDLSWLTIF